MRIKLRCFHDCTCSGSGHSHLSSACPAEPSPRALVTGEPLAVGTGWLERASHRWQLQVKESIRWPGKLAISGWDWKLGCPNFKGQKRPSAPCLVSAKASSLPEPMRLRRQFRGVLSFHTQPLPAQPGQQAWRKIKPGYNVAS